MERETFKYPNFDVEYTAEDLASVPPMTYDPYDRELVPLLYFSCPYKTTFEIEISRMKDQGPDKENAAELSAASVKLTKPLEAISGRYRCKMRKSLPRNSKLKNKGLFALANCKTRLPW